MTKENAIEDGSFSVSIKETEILEKDDWNLKQSHRNSLFKTLQYSRWVNTNNLLQLSGPCILIYTMIPNIRYGTPSEIWISVKVCPKCCMGLPQTKKLLFIWNSNFPGHPIVLFVKSGNPRWMDCGWGIGGQMSGWDGIGYRDRTFGIIFSGQGVCVSVLTNSGCECCVNLCVFLRIKPAKEGLWWEFEEIVQHREQNICCWGDENVNICTVITAVTHCVIFDKSYNLSVIQGFTLI